MSLIEMLYWVKYITIITHGLEILYWFKYLKVLLFQLFQANDTRTHMGNETVHRVVCPLTNRGFPFCFFHHETFFGYFVQKYLKGWFPGQILLSSSDIGKVKSIKPMALPTRGRFTTVWVCTLSKVLHRTPLHSGILNTQQLLLVWLRPHFQNTVVLIRVAV